MSDSQPPRSTKTTLPVLARRYAGLLVVVGLLVVIVLLAPTVSPRVGP